MTTYHFNKAAGSTVRHPFWMQNVDKTPINMTGWTARMMLRKRYSDKAPALTLTTENLGVEFAPLEGKFTIIITDARNINLNQPDTHAAMICNNERTLHNQTKTIIPTRSTTTIKSETH